MIDDIFEENDVNYEAALITEGFYTDLGLDDDDWYRILINESTNLILTIFIITPNRWLNITFYDKYFENSSSNIVTNNFTIS